MHIFSGKSMRPFRMKLNANACSFIGLLLIGIYCALSAVYYRYFVQLNICLPFLDFPVFIGEILLFVCLILLVMQWRITGRKFERWHYIFGIYVGWILIKALHGYYAWGPLSFRNAALFYYALFAVFGYCFFRKEFFTQRRCLFILGFLFLTKWGTPLMNNYIMFPYLILAIILALKIENRCIKFILVFLIMSMTSSHFILLDFSFLKNLIAEGARARGLGHTTAILFLAIIFIAMVKIRNIYKYAILLIAISLFAGTILKYSDKNALESMTNIPEIVKRFEYTENFIAQRDGFELEPRPVQLYSKEKETFKEVMQRISSMESQDQRLAFQFNQGEIDGKVSVPELNDLQKIAEHEVVREALTKDKREPARNLGTAYNNIFFRLYIWRDMLAEIINEKAWFGINFGKPQRSRSLEILGWAKHEWGKDGWITPHNSFLHIIYRAGIVGVAMVIGIFSVIIGLIRRFMRMRSVKGIFLMSIFIYWVIVANFLVFLEFPYSAIPFWTLLGMTFAYSQSQCSGASSPSVTLQKSSAS